jgi:sialidase-1
VVQGFAIDPAWKPADGKGARPGFKEVPALVGTMPGAEFEFQFTGTGAGLFITSGPDAGTIETSVDGGEYRSIETITRWSSGLHLPWAVILDDGLELGTHTIRVRIGQGNGSPGHGHALRVFHLLLN